MDRSISASPSLSSKSRPWRRRSASSATSEPHHRRLLDQGRYLAPALPVAFVLALARGLTIGFEPATQAFGQGVPVPAQPFPEIGAGVFEDRAGAYPVLRVTGFERAAQGPGGDVRERLAEHAVPHRQRQRAHPAMEGLA